MTDSTINPITSWLKVHQSALYTGADGIHDPEKSTALAALSLRAGVVLSGAVFGGNGSDKAEKQNELARSALMDSGNADQAFRSAFLKAPASAAAWVAETARSVADFDPAAVPPTLDQFNKLTSTIVKMPLMFATTSMSLTGSTSKYKTKDDAFNGITGPLPIEMPENQRTELRSLIERQAQTAMNEGQAAKRDLEIYLFSLDVGEAISFGISGSTWTVGAACKKPRPAASEKKLKIKVTLKGGINAVLHFKTPSWDQETAAKVAPLVDSLPSFGDWVQKFSTPAPKKEGDA